MADKDICDMSLQSFSELDIGDFKVPEDKPGTVAPPTVQPAQPTMYHAKLNNGDFAASNFSLSELLTLDEPEAPPKGPAAGAAAAAETGKGWNLHVEPAGAKEAGRKWWPQGGGKKAPVPEGDEVTEVTQISAFRTGSPTPQDSGWDLSVDAGAKPKKSMCIGISGPSHAEGGTDEVLAFESLPESP
eukprot:CAMPEP_0179219176 /NCGR_PEP_ID=MMETSP0797-20121207/4890_1 /TAXON_ID=47934 /ORGANISM="Dinophysis acuminata, Strain DAEP01" /LENGTH=186 /DNA_ID=CAMNT_0020925619 /DNA_START=60 /DNA_END=620 /DNA_ORIENTATION=+